MFLKMLTRRSLTHKAKPIRKDTNQDMATDPNISKINQTMLIMKLKIAGSMKMVSVDRVSNALSNIHLSCACSSGVMENVTEVINASKDILFKYAPSISTIVALLAKIVSINILKTPNPAFHQSPNLLHLPHQSRHSLQWFLHHPLWWSMKQEVPSMLIDMLDTIIPTPTKTFLVCPSQSMSPPSPPICIPSPMCLLHSSPTCSFTVGMISSSMRETTTATLDNSRAKGGKCEEEEDKTRKTKELYKV